MNYLGTYIGRDGVLLLDAAGKLPEFIGPFSRFTVPADVWARAARLEMRFGRNRHEYASSWCARKSEAEYRAAA